MSDFDAFTGSDAPAQEEDPAAEFLAREQEELAELNDDNFTGAEFSEQQRLDQEEDVPASSDPYSSVRSVDTQRKEPEKIKIWREEQMEMLEKKDQDETVKMEEWREQARKELDDWYRHRDEQFQKAKALNRESEAEFIKERDESLPGHEWERICRLCEFNPKNNRSQKDASRMRSILLQLKQNPTVQAKVV